MVTQAFIVDNSGDEVFSDQFSRRDHGHGMPTGVPVTIGTSNSEGTSSESARRDHTHANNLTVHINDSAPSSSDGEDGDIWLEY